MRKESLRFEFFAVITATLLYVAGLSFIFYVVSTTFLAPYFTMAQWVFSAKPETFPTDLLQQTGQHIAENEAIERTSVRYPQAGDCYATISIPGTRVDAPVYYGDTPKLLNKGVGTYVDDSGAGIPGEGKTILLAGHNNTFFHGLKEIELGDSITLATHYGTYTYTVVNTRIAEYTQSDTYDFTRTDENLILYTCYPFDTFGLTPQRFFVYATYVSGPKFI